MNNAIVTSPCFSCGMGHILEMMLLLDVKVDSFGQLGANHWINNSDGWRLSKTGYEHYKSHSKYVSIDKPYIFSDNSSILIEHNPLLVHEIEKYKRTILLVRDPIDSIFSWYRRCEIGNKGLSFEKYLDSNQYFFNHYPFSIFQARPLDIYAIYCAFWLAYCDDIFVLRFEDLKSSNEKWRELLNFIDSPRKDNEINDALKLANSPSSDINFTKINNKGATYEYRERMSVKEHQNLLKKGMIKGIAAKFNYIDDPKINKSIFPNIGTNMEKLSLLGFIESQKIFHGKNEISDSKTLIEFHDNYFFQNIKYNMRRVVTHGYSFSYNNEDVNYIICHKMIIRFIKELYATPRMISNSKLFNFYISMMRFIYSNFKSNKYIYGYEKILLND